MGACLAPVRTRSCCWSKSWVCSLPLLLETSRQRVAQAPSVPTAVDRSAWVVSDRSYFQSEPEVVHSGDSLVLGYAKAYVVRGDEVHEQAIVAVGPPPVPAAIPFACVTFGKTTTGWIKANSLCLPARPRGSRSEPRVSRPREYRLRKGATRSRATKLSLSGTFASDNASLTTEFQQGGRVRFHHPSSRMPPARREIAGVATVDHLTAADEQGTRLTFPGDGVDLRVGPGAKCPGFLKEFFFDPGGECLSPPKTTRAVAAISMSPSVDKDRVHSFPFHPGWKTAVLANDAGAIAQLIQFPISVVSRA